MQMEPLVSYADVTITKVRSNRITLIFRSKYRLWALYLNFRAVVHKILVWQANIICKCISSSVKIRDGC